MADAAQLGGLAGFGATAERVASRFTHTATGALTVLSLYMVVALVGGGVVAFVLYGTPGLIAAASAAFVCWAASAAALFVTYLFTGTPSAATGLLLSIGLRTGVPLAAAAILSSASPVLASGGVFGFFVIYYLLSLTAETVLSVGLINSRKRMGKAS